MSVIDLLAIKKDYKTGVKHCTFNPKGPGVVRMHLIPPRFSVFKRAPYIVILNGYYLLPVGYSWALMLSNFIDEVNKYDGKPLEKQDFDTICDNTVKRTLNAYPFSKKDYLLSDLDFLLDVLFKVAKGISPNVEIEKLSIRSYAGNMTAPHRMDLMISAMTQEGKWHCNQKCLFCYAGKQEMASVKELSTDEWKKVIDTLRKSGVPMVTFTGGEPTMRSDLTELVDYSRWFVTRLNTNGVLLSKELCKSLADASLDSVQITLYSSSEDVHNKLVGAENFSKTVEGIQNAVEAGLDVSINTPLCSLNENYVDTLKFAHSLGVKYATFSGLICTGNAESKVDVYDLPTEKLSTILQQAKEFADENEMEIDFTSPGLIDSAVLEKLGMNVPCCGACLSNMAIAPDGTVVPCQSWLGGVSLGNVLTDDFKTIWNNDLCKKLRSMNEQQALCCPFRKEGK